MMVRFVQFLTRYKTVLILFALTALIASAQSLLLGKKNYLPGGLEYNTYNNYTIFKQSFYHLVSDKDLYILYPVEHWDLYKYSPTFALLFGAFALLPDMIGLPGWNMLNALILVIGIYYLPHLTSKQKGWIAIACIVESMTALQNEQSNGLMAGLIIMAFGLSERKNFFWAALCIVLTVFIKIFGIVAFSIFIFYRPKWKTALYSFFWTLILLLLPLLVIEPYQLTFLYKSWARMLSIDHDVSYGLSVLGWLYSWFAIEANKMAVMLAGAVMFLLPFIRLRSYSHYGFRLLALASMLIWMVIFNHKAESPTFIIAMAGVSIWFFMHPRKWWDVVLFIAAVLLTTLSPTDIVPPFLKKNLIEPYVLKAVPCILIWLRIIYEMLIYRDQWYAKEGHSMHAEPLSVA